ncbi:hypothetical protein BXU09_19935 [Deinococcus sp. LM3]|nr:hypothetical protein BXU09_19935 [Deinococcus sp. LM3]
MDGDLGAWRNRTDAPTGRRASRACASSRERAFSTRGQGQRVCSINACRERLLSRSVTALRRPWTASASGVRGRAGTRGRPLRTAAYVVVRARRLVGVMSMASCVSCTRYESASRAAVTLRVGTALRISSSGRGFGEVRRTARICAAAVTVTRRRAVVSRCRACRAAALASVPASSSGVSRAVRVGGHVRKRYSKRGRSGR